MAMNSFLVHKGLRPASNSACLFFEMDYIQMYAHRLDHPNSNRPSMLMVILVPKAHLLLGIIELRTFLSVELMRI